MAKKNPPAPPVAERASKEYRFHFTVNDNDVWSIHKLADDCGTTADTVREWIDAGLKAWRMSERSAMVVIRGFDLKAFWFPESVAPSNAARTVQEN